MLGDSSKLEHTDYSNTFYVSVGVRVFEVLLYMYYYYINLNHTLINTVTTSITYQCCYHKLSHHILLHMYIRNEHFRWAYKYRVYICSLYMERLEYHTCKRGSLDHTTHLFSVA